MQATCYMQYRLAGIISAEFPLSEKSRLEVAENQYNPPESLCPTQKPG